MKVAELLEAKSGGIEDVLPPKVYSLMLGRSVGKALCDIRDHYNSLDVVSYSSTNHELVLTMHAGGNVPVASMVKKYAKANGLSANWKFDKEMSRDSHDYIFSLPPGTALDKDAFIKGVLETDFQKKYTTVYAPFNLDRLFTFR